MAKRADDALLKIWRYFYGGTVAAFAGLGAVLSVATVVLIPVGLVIGFLVVRYVRTWARTEEVEELVLAEIRRAAEQSLSSSGVGPAEQVGPTIVFAGLPRDWRVQLWSCRTALVPIVDVLSVRFSSEQLYCASCVLNLTRASVSRNRTNDIRYRDIDSIETMYFDHEWTPPMTSKPVTECREKVAIACSSTEPFEVDMVSEQAGGVRRWEGFALVGGNRVPWQEAVGQLRRLTRELGQRGGPSAEASPVTT